MNNSLLNKIPFVLFLLASLFFNSCGSSSSGGDEEEFEFKLSDLTNKYWYSSTFISDNYSTNDAVIVYLFDADGELFRQEYSGRRDVEVGTWSFSSENILTINDETLSDSQEWRLDRTSTNNHLFLKGINGNRNFYTEINELEDVYADAFLVKNIYLKQGSYIAEYRYEFEVMGEQIESVKALVSENESYNLVKTINAQGQSVWKIKPGSLEEPIRYLETFPGEGIVKFVLKMNSGEEYKLDEKIYATEIDALEIQEIDTHHTTGSGRLSLTVEWKRLAEDDDVLYAIQILNSDEDENNPLYTERIPSVQSGTMQEYVLRESAPGSFGLNLGDGYFVKILAFKYEDMLNELRGSDYDYNIQVKSQFIKNGGSW